MGPGGVAGFECPAFRGTATHTIIMREIMKYPLQVLRALGLSKGDQPPSEQDVLEAALDVEEIDPYTKQRIKAVLEILPKLDEARNA